MSIISIFVAEDYSQINRKKPGIHSTAIGIFRSKVASPINPYNLASMNNNAKKNYINRSGRQTICSKEQYRLSWPGSISGINIRYAAITAVLTVLLQGSFLNAQVVSGTFSGLSNQSIKLEGFDGLKTYPISSATTDEKGNFSLNYSKADYGVGYLISADQKSLIVILSGEDVEIRGEALSNKETIKIVKGRENKWFEQFALEHPRREQALSAWIYLERIYSFDTLFSVHQQPARNIQTEKQRIKDENATFLSGLPKDSYVYWFLPIRKLVSSVSVVAQYRPEEIPATIAAFRKLDYTDARLYKSGLYKEAIENHFWLLENSGGALDSVYFEMKCSIDTMMVKLMKNQKILNEVTQFLFDVLERQSLFKVSEYLALKVLNDNTCTINSDLARQLESYRAMKKGNTAPDILFGDMAYVKGVKSSQYTNLASLKTPYTLVVFGASWCPKCSEEFPQLKQKYPKWRDVGMEVVYVSLDDDRSAFEQSVASYPFPVYCDFKKWGGKIVGDYFVFSTPTMFLLDGKREIILRPVSVSHVDAWVDWFLVQGNLKSK